MTDDDSQDNGSGSGSDDEDEEGDTFDTEAAAASRLAGVVITDREYTDDYDVGKQIGSGAYSKVYQCSDKATGEAYAVKVVTKSRLKPKDLAALQDEVEVMCKLRHKNIVRLHGVYETPSTFSLVTELCTGGELFDKIVEKEHYSELEAQKVVRTLAKGIAYCHSRNIVHRDLKVSGALGAPPCGACVCLRGRIGLSQPNYARLCCLT